MGNGRTSRRRLQKGKVRMSQRQQSAVPGVPPGMAVPIIGQQRPPVKALAVHYQWHYDVFGPAFPSTVVQQSPEGVGVHVFGGESPLHRMVAAVVAGNCELAFRPIEAVDKAEALLTEIDKRLREQAKTIPQRKAEPEPEPGVTELVEGLKR